jgi:hypothetical protein
VVGLYALIKKNLVKIAEKRAESKSERELEVK